jgi:AcrR family transcriptional regulator
MKKELSERQREIIKASLELIAEKGIQGLTIKNLSEKIGHVESAIYRHFKNKIEILNTILETIKENSLGDNYKKDVNTIVQLEERLKSNFKTFAASPALVSVVFSEDLFQNEASLLDKTKEVMQKSIKELTRIIRYGQKRGELRDDIHAESLAIMIIGTVRMFVKQWKMSGYSFDLVRKGNIIIKSITQVLKN